MTTAFEDPLDTIEDEARAMALCFGMADSQAIEAARSLMDRVRERLAGTCIYVPSSGTRQRQEKYAAIRKKFTGTNIKQLAKEYELTPRQVHRIVT